MTQADIVGGTDLAGWVWQVGSAQTNVCLNTHPLSGKML